MSLKRKQHESQTTSAELKIGAIPQNSVCGEVGVECYNLANKHLATAGQWLRAVTVFQERGSGSATARDKPEICVYKISMCQPRMCLKKTRGWTASPLFFFNNTPVAPDSALSAVPLIKTLTEQLKGRARLWYLCLPKLFLNFTKAS